MYIYIYIHVCVHIYIYIYIYMYMLVNHLAYAALAKEGSISKAAVKSSIASSAKTMRHS